MRFLVPAIVLVACLFGSGASAQTITEQCQKATNPASCARKARQNLPCAYYQGQCVQDPCYTAANASQCLQWSTTDMKCLSLPFLVSGVKTDSLPFTCTSYHMICNRISPANCLSTGFCAKKGGDSYCGYAVLDGEGGTGDATSECTSFPLWSIALAVLWVFIMLILIAIIALAMKKKQSAITGVEGSNVDIAGVTVNGDNFMPTPGLQDPLNR